MLTTASTTSMLTLLFGEFFTIFSDNFIPIIGALLGLGVVYFAYRKMKSILYTGSGIESYDDMEADYEFYYGKKKGVPHYDD